MQLKGGQSMGKTEGVSSELEGRHWNPIPELPCVSKKRLSFLMGDGQPMKFIIYLLNNLI